jgi:hypothetical protein
MNQDQEVPTAVSELSRLVSILIIFKYHYFADNCTLTNKFEFQVLHPF